MLVITGLGYRALAFVTAIRVVVDGWSMYPTLAPGEYVLFDRLPYRREAPKRGDVALVRGVLGDGRAIIKRVVGAPGDTVLLSIGARSRLTAFRRIVRPCLRMSTPARAESGTSGTMNTSCWVTPRSSAPTAAPSAPSRGAP